MHMKSARLILATITALLGAPVTASQPDRVQFTVEVRDFNYPFARALGNEAAFAAMMQHATIVGHYDSLVSRTRFELTSCMTGVMCFPDPHFTRGPEHQDRPIQVNLEKATAQPDGSWQVQFELPEQNHHTTLNTVTLVLAVSDLWAEPLVSEDVLKAATLVPSYDQYNDAQKQRSVNIDLIAPKAAGGWSQLSQYCPAINNPRTWSHSGTVRVRMRVQPVHEKLYGQGGDLLKWVPQEGQCLK
jgi:hypothetical protein